MAHAQYMYARTHKHPPTPKTATVSMFDTMFALRSVDLSETSGSALRRSTKTARPLEAIQPRLSRGQVRLKPSAEVYVLILDRSLLSLSVLASRVQLRKTSSARHWFWRLIGCALSEPLYTFNVTTQRGHTAIVESRSSHNSQHDARVRESSRMQSTSALLERRAPLGLVASWARLHWRYPLRVHDPGLVSSRIVSMTKLSTLLS